MLFSIDNEESIVTPRLLTEEEAGMVLSGKVRSETLILFRYLDLATMINFVFSGFNFSLFLYVKIWI